MLRIALAVALLAGCGGDPVDAPAGPKYLHAGEVCASGRQHECEGAQCGCADGLLCWPPDGRPGPLDMTCAPKCVESYDDACSLPPCGGVVAGAVWCPTGDPWTPADPVRTMNRCGCLMAEDPHWGKWYPLPPARDKMEFCVLLKPSDRRKPWPWPYTFADSGCWD